MKWYDLLSLSLTNLWRRKLRSILTLLGVIIGTASIVTMLSIGIGQSEAMMKMIDQSSDLTTVNVRNDEGGMMIDASGNFSQIEASKKKLNMETVNEIRQLPNVKYASPVLTISIRVQQGVYENYIYIEGMTADALATKKIHIIEGELPDFTKKQDHLPLVIGRDITYQFYNPNSHNWEPAEVDLINKPSFATWDMDAYYNAQGGEGTAPKKHLLHVDGIMGSPDEQQWSPNLYSAYTEIGHLEDFLNQTFKGKAWPGQPKSKSGKPVGEVIYDSIIVGSTDLEHTKEVLEQIRDMGFQVDSNIEFIDSMRQQSANQQMVLGGIGGISLFVAAIGIANTMMMSVYERTKEIGIFKVLGCSLKNIRNIFLAEACLIGLIGGVLGIGLSFIVSSILNNASGQGMEALGIYPVGADGSPLSIIPLWLVAGAIGFATIIGMLAGVMPARRAMKLSALEALRT
ncbi:MAG: ABC transporter permease [Clostridiaceae bacterium]|nr:ABC transporter permease [Clostridiaceae bacterium]